MYRREPQLNRKSEKRTQRPLPARLEQLVQQRRARQRAAPDRLLQRDARWQRFQRYVWDKSR
jgi:hypothetical protein